MREEIKYSTLPTAQPRDIYQETKQRLQRLFSVNRFYHRREARRIDDEVYDIVRTIREELAPRSTEEAVLALKYLVERDSKILESMDTSDGTVYPHLQDAVALLGKLWASDPKASTTKIAEYVHKRVLNNGYGVFDSILEGFKDALGEAGLQTLEQLLRADIAKTTDAYDRQVIITQLKDIADVEQDVDKYLALQIEFPSAHTQYEHLNAGKRLADAGRAEEALERMRQVSSTSMAWRETIDSTLLKCYEILGRTEDSTKLIEARFFENPTEALLNQLISLSGGDIQERERLIDQLETRKVSQHGYMAFLTQTKEVERLAAIVIKHPNRWDGDNYYVLAPAAKLLEERFPLQATILYRALMESLLARALSKYYHHAAGYWKKITELESRIVDFTPVSSHDDYITAMRETHKRKSSFWSTVAELLDPLSNNNTLELPNRGGE